MDKQELVELLDEGNSMPLCEKKDERVYRLSTGEDVTDQMFPHLFIKGKYGYHSDGIYRLSEYTCGGTCEINKPAAKCVAKGGMYSEFKCAKYGLYTANSSYYLDVATLLNSLK